MTDKIPEWRSPPIDPASQQKTIDDIKQMLTSIYQAVEAGTVAAISVVAIRDNLVPQHAYVLSPFSAAMLLAGMQMAEDQLKAQSMQIMTRPPSGPDREPSREGEQEVKPADA